MSRIKDLTGVAFGDLIVLQLDKIVNSRSLWLCQCKCSNLVKVRGNNLTCGTTKSCGCLRSEITTSRNLNIPLKIVCVNGHSRKRNKFGQCKECVINQGRIHDKKRRQTEERRKYMEEYLRKYYEDNKEKLDASNKQWIKDHPEVKKAMSLKCKTNRNLRIVAWTDWPEIKKIYKNCPKEQVVDHYIPLQGSEVSGLHVNWNLQYLEPIKNLQKWNRVDLKEISEWYGELLKQEGLK